MHVYTLLFIIARHKLVLWFQFSVNVYEPHCFDLPYSSKQIKCHTAAFCRTNKLCSLQQCCQAVEEGTISTLVHWDTDAQRAFNISNFKFLFGFVNANQTQLISSSFLNRQTKDRRVVNHGSVFSRINVRFNGDNSCENMSGSLSMSYV